MGTLKGYDQLMNLVLDNVKEITRGWSLRNQAMCLGESLTACRRRGKLKPKAVGVAGGARNPSRSHLTCRRQ